MSFVESIIALVKQLVECYYCLHYANMEWKDCKQAPLVEFS